MLVLIVFLGVTDLVAELHLDAKRFCAAKRSLRRLLRSDDLRPTELDPLIDHTILDEMRCAPCQSCPLSTVHVSSNYRNR
jgi:hypothetical protein